MESTIFCTKVHLGTTTMKLEEQMARNYHFKEQQLRDEMGQSCLSVSMDLVARYALQACNWLAVTDSACRTKIRCDISCLVGERALAGRNTE